MDQPSPKRSSRLFSSSPCRSSWRQCCCRYCLPSPLKVSEGSRHVVVNPRERLQQEAEAYLGRYAEGLCAHGLSARTAVRVGDAATEIAAGAREYQVDLIAMTTHGRSGLSRLLFGSVAEAVLRRASVPVFLMRITEAEAARPAA